MRLTGFFSTYFKNFFYAALLLNFASLTAQAYTNLQTSTYVGVYRDYFKKEHYPLYHSWSLRGIYGNGTEAALDFYINTDFAVNEAKVNPTQAMISFPIHTIKETDQLVLSEVRLGRMFYTEGFDVGFLDGAEIEWRWSAEGGLMPFGGMLSPTDFSDTDMEMSPTAGLIFWESLYGFNMRFGAIVKDKEFVDRSAFTAVQKQFTDLPLQPLILLKGEWIYDQNKEISFNQSHLGMQLQLTEQTSAALDYANLEPRPLSSLNRPNFMYDLFAVTPTETLRANITWQNSKDLSINFGAEAAMYNSGFEDERSHSEEVSCDWQWSSGEWISPNLTYLKSYGGEVSNLGLRYTSELSDITKLSFNFNTAYMKKINKIEGWAQNLRGDFETHFWNRAKFGFAVEVERNNYYIFDARAQVYVTNYL